MEAVKDTFALKKDGVGPDRRMITIALVDALRDLGGFGWVTALRAPAIAAVAEITHPNYSEERLFACPALPCPALPCPALAWPSGPANN